MCKMYGVIEQLCSERGIKPGKLCADLKISRGILSDLKAGRTKRLSAQNIAKISAYFGVTADYLLERSGYKVIELFAGCGGPASALTEIKIMPTVSDEHDPIDDVDLAFYGEYKELSEDDKETVRDMVRIMRQRRAAKENNK